jgi:hypothetical protein
VDQEACTYSTSSQLQARAAADIDQGWQVSGLLEDSRLVWRTSTR